MKKYFLVSLLVLCLVLTACGKKTPTEEMPAEDQEKYIQMSKDAITTLNEEGFAALEDKYSEDMKKAMTADALEKSEEVLAAKGAFKDFGQTAALYYTDEKTSNKYIISQVETLYEDGSLVFTISHDLDDNIIGLFMK